MKFDFDKKILDLDDKEILSDGKAITLADCAITALTEPKQGQDGNKKITNIALALKIKKKGGLIDLTSRETADLKDLCKEMLTPIMAYRSVEILEPIEIKEEKK